MLFLQAIIAIVAILYAYYACRTKVPLVLSSREARDIILQAVQDEARAKSGQKLKIYDLGSGIGGLCFAIAKALPDAEIVGLEMAWPAWLIAVLRQKLRPHKNVRFYLRNFWKYYIGDGDIVVCFLGINLMPDVKNKLQKEARAGRLFISNTFPLPTDWPPTQRIKTKGGLSKEIYIYRQD